MGFLIASDLDMSIAQVLKCHQAKQAWHFDLVPRLLIRNGVEKNKGVI